MFLGNPDLLQRSLVADLNRLIKSVKQREDQYLELLQYNRNLMCNLTEMQQKSFLTDEVNKIKLFQASFAPAHQRIVDEENQMKQKYVCASSSEPSISKLITRVTSRVLDLCMESMEKAKFLEPALPQRYAQMKEALLRNLDGTAKINITLMLETIIDYIQGKYLREFQRLGQIINILVKGNFEELSEVYQPAKSPPRRKFGPFQAEEHNVSLEREKARQRDQQQRKQKQQRRERLRKQDQLRQQNQQHKKRKAKVARDLVTTIYSTMDVSRQQFLEDFGYTNNPEEKKRKLYEEMFSRNKLNYEQILQFQSHKSIFQQKLKDFKQRMQKQSNKIQQALVIVFKKAQRVESKEKDTITLEGVKTQMKSESEDQQQKQKRSTILPNNLQKTFYKLEKKQKECRGSGKSPSPIFAKEISFSAMQSTQDGFQHIKFDLKNEQIFSRSNRAKLPQIPVRSSLDSRYEIKNKSFSEKKDEKRISIMKNVEIGTNTFNIITNKPASNSNNSTTQNSGSKKSPRNGRSNGDGLFENSTGAFEPGHGLGYTFYVRKKVTKFYETKTNFIL